jgi:hypothetical protein
MVVELWNLSYVVLTLKCVFMLMSLVLPVCLRGKIRNTVHQCLEKYVMWNAVSLNNLLPFCNSVFPMWLFHPCFSCSSYPLVWDMRCLQWCEFIMQSGLGHRVVWYMVMNILEEHSRPVFILSQDGHHISWLESWYLQVRMHSPITQSTRILTLNILDFPFFLSVLYLLQTN